MSSMKQSNNPDKKKLYPATTQSNRQQSLKPDHAEKHSSNKIHKDEKEEEEYNPLKIPADWEFARKHALARSVGKPIHRSDQEACPCCGYDIYRDKLNITDSTRSLSFLGSGFPLFYNFIMYCILILMALFACKGALDFYTNLQGDFCDGIQKNAKGQNCPDTWIHVSSIANKSNRPDIISFQANFNILILVVISIILFYFRKSQRQIDKQIDEELCTPADYTLMVKNIPKGLQVNYITELEKIFTYYAVPESEQQIVVTKVSLVYEIDEIIEKEESLAKLVEEKQEILIKNNLNFSDIEIRQIDKKILKVDEEIEKLKDEYQEDGERFAGIAFVSFFSEAMKDDVLVNNDHTYQDKMTAFFNSGQSKNLSHNDLSWMNQKLFLEPAPEPNDVDWEFVHVSTKQKIKWRSFSWSISLVFMILCFGLIYALSSWADELNDYADEHEETLDTFTTYKIDMISGSISWVIVLFNKFVMGITYHHIVDTERISSKTKFNIQFATKLTYAMFVNTAMLSYIIDILLMGNIVTKGGFIQNETNVFILNAFFPPAVWLIDPYGIIKRYQRNKELEKHKKGLSVVTQQQANFLMEHTEYYQAKRYADIMKTMWFTFLFGGVIPLGIVFSITGLSCYFWIDKFNVMRRRSVKENLAKEVSIEMIEMLELTIILFGIGNMAVNYQFYGFINWQDIVVVLVGLLFAVVPMQDINNFVFQIEDHPETQTYDQVEQRFVTDYDRENPVTKKHALEVWMRNQKIVHQSMKPEKSKY